jgi:DNA invertase Pin-like site-specific DNA recombinase
MQRAVLYRRVSGDAQEDNTSLGEQERQCEAHCIERGYRVVAREQDIVSGKFILARSGFRRVRDLFEAGGADVLVVHNPDRLGRGKTIGQLEFIIEQAGGTVEYVMPQPDPDTAEGVVMHAANQMISGVERLTFRRRSIAGKIARARQGKVLAGRMPKYGYRYEYQYSDGRVVGCTLVIDESKIVVYRMIVDWFLDGIPAESLPPLTLRKIAMRLNALSIPTPTGRGQWSRHTLNSILSSAVYEGRWEYNRRIYKTNDSEDGPKSLVIGYRDDSEVVTVRVPAAITEDRWQAIQTRLAYNKRHKFISPATNNYLLRSLCYCAECHWRMVVKSRKGRAAVYKCQSRNDASRRRCSTGLVSAAALDAAAWGAIVYMCDNDAHVQAAHKTHTERANTTAQYDAAIAHYRKAIDAALARLKRFTEQQISGVGDAVAGALADVARSIDAEIRGAESTIAELQGKRAALIAVAEQEQALDALRVRVRAAMRPDMAFAAKREILEQLQARCDWNHAARVLTVTCLLGSVDVPVLSR